MCKHHQKPKGKGANSLFLEAYFIPIFFQWVSAPDPEALPSPFVTTKSTIGIHLYEGDGFRCRRKVHYFVSPLRYPKDGEEGVWGLCVAPSTLCNHVKADCCLIGLMSRDRRNLFVKAIISFEDEGKGTPDWDKEHIRKALKAMEEEQKINYERRTLAAEEGADSVPSKRARFDGASEVPVYPDIAEYVVNPDQSMIPTLYVPSAGNCPFMSAPSHEAQPSTFFADYQSPVDDPFCKISQSSDALSDMKEEMDFDYLLASSKAVVKLTGSEGIPVDFSLPSTVASSQAVVETTPEMAGIPPQEAEDSFVGGSYVTEPETRTVDPKDLAPGIDDCHIFESGLFGSEEPYTIPVFSDSCFFSRL